MPDRDYLTAMIQRAVNGCSSYWAGLIAEYLLAHGVTIPVRCNDCKHLRHNLENDTYCAADGLADPRENDFCSHGERRSDD